MTTFNRRQFLGTTASGLAGAMVPGNVFPRNTFPGNVFPNTSEAEKITIQVNAAADLGPLTHAWAFFGHDEANYSYTENGKKLLADLSAFSPVPVFMRAHHLFTSGDPATTALKWSPTNVYTEDAQGNPVYDWSLGTGRCGTSRIFSSGRAPPKSI